MVFLNVRPLYDVKAVQLSVSDLAVSGSSGTVSYTWDVKDAPGWKAKTGQHRTGR